jgi:hypothetical protein
MSWDARLIDDRGHYEGDWSYTHNTSRMIYAVLDDAGIELPASTRPCMRLVDREWVNYPQGYGSIAWWDHLDGMSGPEGAAYLNTIVKGLEAEPERFRKMDPPNGWGNYYGLVKILTEMRDAVPEWPCKWEASG